MVNVRPETFARWATVPGTHSSGQANRVEPTEAKKDAGWDYQEFPPANWDNWITGVLADEGLYLDEKLTACASQERMAAGYVSGLTVTEVSGPSNDASVSTGVAWAGGERWDTVVTAFNNLSNATHYVYVDTDGTVKESTTVATAFADGTVPIATVVVAAGDITSITHHRPRSKPARPYVTVGPAGNFTDLAAAVAYAKGLQAATALDQVKVLVTGTVTVTAAITVDFPLHLVGNGSDAKVQWNFDGSCFVLNNAAASRSTFEDVEFKYTGAAATASVAIDHTTGVVTRVLVSRCSFDPDGDDILVAIRSTAQTASWEIADCRFPGGANTIVTAIQSTHASSTRFEIDRCKFTAIGTLGVDAQDGSHFKVTGCTFANLLQAVSIAAAHSKVSQCQAVDCIGVTNKGVFHVTGEYSKVSDIDVYDWTTGWAIRATGVGTSIANDTCTTTEVENTCQGGVYSSGAGAGVTHNVVSLARGQAAGDGCKDATGIYIGGTQTQLGSNRVFGVGRTGDLGFGIDVDASSVVGIGNLVGNVRGVGIRINAKGVAVGCLVTGYGTERAFQFTASADESIGSCNLIVAGGGGGLSADFSGADVVWQLNSVDESTSGLSSQFAGADSTNNNANT